MSRSHSSAREEGGERRREEEERGERGREREREREERVIDDARARTRTPAGNLSPVSSIKLKTRLNISSRTWLCISNSSPLSFSFSLPFFFFSFPSSPSLVSILPTLTISQIFEAKLRFSVRSRERERLRRKKKGKENYLAR